jgi:hypothetical protein
MKCKTDDYQDLRHILLGLSLVLMLDELLEYQVTLTLEVF